MPSPRITATPALLLAALLILPTACVDPRDDAPPAASWEVAESPTPTDPMPTTDPTPATPADALPAHWTRHDRPTAQLDTTPETLLRRCGDHAPMAPALADGPHAEPTLTEQLDGQGCLIDRVTVHRASDGSPLLERYEIFNVEALPLTFVQPIAYEHTWQTQQVEGGEEVVQVRRRLEDARMFYTLTERFDAGGRLVERVQTGHDAWFPTEAEHLSTQRWVYAGERLITQEVWSGDRLTSRTHTTLDAQGRPVRTTHTRDGQTITTHAWTYDGATTIEEVSDASGGPHTYTVSTVLSDGTTRLITERLDTGLREETTLDAEGRERRYEQDEDLDGRPEYVRTTDYDAAGHKTFEGTAYSFDAQAIPRRGSTSRHTFDAQGRPLRSTRYSWPQHVLGDAPDLSRLPTPYNLIMREEHSYTTTTHLSATTQTYIGALPQPDMLASYEREARAQTLDGRPLWDRADTNADGTPDQRHEWRYDPAGRLVATQTLMLEQGVLTPTAVQTITRDAQGRPLSEITDEGADGTPDAAVLYGYGEAF